MSTRSINEDKLLEAESNVTTRNGKNKHVYVSSSPFKNNQGHILGTVSIWLDQTETIEAKERADADAKASSAKKAAEEAANKKAESKKIASTAKRDFEGKVKGAWRVPPGTSGKKVQVRFILSDSGTVTSFRITQSSGDENLDESIKSAVYAAAPYPMPSDSEARKQAKEVVSTFTAN